MIDLDSSFLEVLKIISKFRNYPLFVAIFYLLCLDMVAADKFVGTEVCAGCHLNQYQKWKNSHHDLAMQVATVDTVLGNFDNKTFSYFDTTSTFFKKENKYFVQTDGPEGKLENFEIKYTFGVYPLQQYLIEFPDGRLQSLSIAWDSRTQEKGGQRWFHLYPDEHIEHDNPLHWTKLNQNWNYMCAECHSTNLEKNYNQKSNSYQTTWSEINVACEACHGPGKEHISWAQLEEENRLETSNGLSVELQNSATWIVNPTTGLAARSPLRKSAQEIETCALCHSRRASHQDKYVHGTQLLHSHLPAMLDEQLYYIDGQIDDEVYVYGSFLQSKMYQSGVTCSDCHNPHSLQLKVQGNGLCNTCHLAIKFDTTKHHFHATESKGAQCTACHMPERTYMKIDDRADHSFRIPRPDLSVKLGVPNACTQCHQDKDDEWATENTRSWYPSSIRREEAHYGEVAHAGRHGKIDASKLLVEFVSNSSQPAIMRASATAILQNYLNPDTLPIVKNLLRDENELVRLNAIQVADSLPPALKAELLTHLLSDELKIIRIEAGRTLADSREHISNSNVQKQLDRAIEDYITAQNINGERPEAHVNLGALYVRIQNFDRAEFEYKKAIDIDPTFIPAYVNLADLYRTQSLDEKSKHYLSEAIKVDPNSGLAHHSLGLFHVRQQNLDVAMKFLQTAVQLEPENIRFQYIYSVALDSKGHTKEAIDKLTVAHNKRPIDRDILYALVSYHQKVGNSSKAKHYAKILTEVSPWDQNAQALLNSF